jgi:hypothetical protein
MTNQKMLDRAMFLIGNLEAGETTTAADSADLLAALNGMMAMWALEDKDLQYPPQDTLTDTFPLPLWTEEPIAYNLAMRAATLFSLPVPPDVAFIARSGEIFIAKTLINNKLLPLDMRHMPAGGGRWSIVTDSVR